MSKKERIRRLLPLLGRFLVVGLLGTVVNLVGLWFLTQLHILQLVAVVVATEVSIIHNFCWHDHWTFKKVRDQTLQSSVGQRFWQFQLISSLAAALTLSLFALFSGVWHLYYLLAQALAIGTATLLNFGVNAWFTWRPTTPILVAEISYVNSATFSSEERVA